MNPFEQITEIFAIGNYVHDPGERHLHENALKEDEVQSFDLVSDSNNSENYFGSKPRTPIDIGVIEEREDEQNVTLKDVRKDDQSEQLAAQPDMGDASPIEPVKDG